MNAPFQSFLTSGGLLPDEIVLPQLQRWLAQGKRAALVTLTGVEGGAPRQAGDQMAVCEDGTWVGYLSGGCLEAAVALEAQAVIQSGKNRLVRYGKGSPYFDIKLPCGSGLDLYFDQAVTLPLVNNMQAHRARRDAFELLMDLATGAKTLARLDGKTALAQSARSGGIFRRVYAPSLRLLIIGNGPAVTGMAALSSVLGAELSIISFDEITRSHIAAQHPRIRVLDTLNGIYDHLDFATAAVLILHEHEREPDILEQLLKTNCFYIGALGNHAVHRSRLAALSMRGVSDSDLHRIRAPVGLIAGAKSKATLATGILAEILAEAKAQNLVT